MCPCSALDQIRLEIKQNHWIILKKGHIAYQFKADVQTYGHQPRYTAYGEAAEIDACTQNC
jgi:hypothetical protein